MTTPENKTPYQQLRERYTQAALKNKELFVAYRETDEPYVLEELYDTSRSTIFGAHHTVTVRGFNHRKVAKKINKLIEEEQW